MSLRFLPPHNAVAFAVLLAASAVPSAVLAQTVDSDSAAVAAVVSAFHAALAAGDSAAALDLLAEDATILESGGIETREHYRSGHLRADLQFAKAVARRGGAIHVVVHGDAAWATSTSLAKGEYRDREINSTSAELMVVTRARDGWKIRAIHWSTRRARRE